MKFERWVLDKMCWKRNPCTLLVEMWISTNIVRIYMEAPLKIKNGFTMWTSILIFKGNEISVSKRHMYSHVLCSASYHSQIRAQLKSSWMNEWMNNEDVQLYTHEHTLMQQWNTRSNPVICNNTDKRRKQ